MISLLALAVAAAVPSTLPALHPSGKYLVDSSGHRVTLKGCNLGNWLMLEMWMLGIDGKCGVKDQFDMFQTLDKRFGRAGRDSIMEVYRQNWIQEKDFATIHASGMNLVRLPMDYRLFEDDSNPKVLKPDAFKWIDQTVAWAKKHGIYVILDMHGIQGGQSPYEHTGQSDQNKFWTNRADQERAAWLWTKIAARYKSEPAVVAYDPMNEPYGGTHPQQLERFTELYKAIRKGDPEKLIYFHGSYDGFDHYMGKIKSGFHNAGIQMHYYPGLFGGGEPTINTHRRHFQFLESVAEKVDKENVPFLIGEMNVVFQKAGGGEMMRRYFDFHAAHGWSTTMWSYKAVSGEGGFGDASWGLVTNPKPLGSVNFATDSAEKIKAWFRSLGASAWNPKPDLTHWLTHPNLKPSALESMPKPKKIAPANDKVAGWTASDFGGAIAGGLKNHSDGSFSLFGSGADVWGKADSGRFLHRDATGDFTLSVTVQGLEDVAQYVKAGLMVRQSLTTDAATILLSTFSSGEVQSAFRSHGGQDMQSLGGDDASFPVQLSIERRGDDFGLIFAAKNQKPKVLKSVHWAGAPKTVHVGVLSLSHQTDILTEARYRDLKLVQK